MCPAPLPVAAIATRRVEARKPWGGVGWGSAWTQDSRLTTEGVTFHAQSLAVRIIFNSTLTILFAGCCSGRANEYLVEIVLRSLAGGVFQVPSTTDPSGCRSKVLFRTALGWCAYECHARKDTDQSVTRVAHGKETRGVCGSHAR